MDATYDLKLMEKYLSDKPKSELNDQLIIAAKQRDPKKPSLKKMSMEYLKEEN